MTTTDPTPDLSPELRELLDSVPDTGGVTAETVVYDADVPLEGFLATPTRASSSEALPAVLVLHDWMGVIDHVKVRAQMLARLGYVALAGDIYGQGVRPTPETASAEAGKYYGDVELFRSRLTANLERLRAQPGVDPARIAVIGYCFGGSGALELARSGADVAGVASFHGALGTGAPAEKGAISAPLLVMTGAADPIVPDEAVTAFEDELRAADAPDWQLVSYSDAMHAFAVPGTDAPEHGAQFNATANRRSWAQMTAFFDEVLA
ncbi:dienelactone hydrolase family protein [Frigoribacterium sp. 2-23]|uniref:dienelactone hydrolase family protein n=1 Tax=Frigoribacterium sp. 2-23 TaxID=3415006 RepID=UPI003C6F1F6D